jgi:hypothetical protein
MYRVRIVFLVGVLAGWPVAARADEVLTPAQAATKVGETVTLQMKVKATGRSGAGFADLVSENSHKHPDAFVIRLSPEVQEKMRGLKISDAGKHFNQQFIRVTGKVKIVVYTNIGKRPVIEPEDAGQIEIVDPDAQYAPGDELLSLYRSGKLFKRSAYKEVRAAFARRFEAAHAADLRKAYGEDFAALTDWLARHPETREDLYTALDERHDDIPRALALFKEIWKRHPEALPKWGQLAIATALTWDDERGVYDYRPHQRRAQSVLPEGMLDALGNFKYVVDNEKRMPQPVASYPWEFLAFVVNHRTPLRERNWAFGYYETAKVRLKSWHQDPPYDHGLLQQEINKNSSAAGPRLAGKPYTLDNLKTFGGVCAHQADFASRTAKSLGIPAVYCHGASAYREGHAWWMYVNISSATKDQLKIVLRSDGRLDGFNKDQFYTGLVLDPQSGREILDRDMERRLWVAGSDRVGKRLSALVMRAYPGIARAASLGTREKIAYLDQCLKVSRYDEDAWLQLALMARRGELNAENKKTALSRLATLKQTFVNYPDFVWRVFTDLIEVADNAEKIKQGGSLLKQFQKPGRADLVCDARLWLTELLVAQGKHAQAFSGLQATVGGYATEGRYVPKLVQKMEELSAKVKSGPAQVAQVYITLLPAMITYYKSDSSVYYKRMREQATKFLAQHNLMQAATTLEARIAVAKASLRLK